VTALTPGVRSSAVKGFRVRATLQLRNAALVEAREARGWTQVRLGREVGCSNTIIGHAERLKGHLVSPQMAERIGAALGLPTDVVRPPWSVDAEVPSRIESTAELRPEQMAALAANVRERALLPSPDETAVEEERKEILRGAVRCLPDRQALPVILHYFQGLKLSEVAELLDVPVRTVESRLGAARQWLREELAGEVLR